MTSLPCSVLFPLLTSVSSVSPAVSWHLAQQPPHLAPVPPPLPAGTTESVLSAIYSTDGKPVPPRTASNARTQRLIVSSSPIASPRKTRTSCSAKSASVRLRSRLSTAPHKAIQRPGCRLQPQMLPASASSGAIAGGSCLPGAWATSREVLTSTTCVDM